tara:strand:+ start:871 stop:1011 length:141 start_codon:yes stop_codon:yes gene_type:complete
LFFIQILKDPAFRKLKFDVPIVVLLADARLAMDFFVVLPIGVILSK